MTGSGDTQTQTELTHAGPRANSERQAKSTYIRSMFGAIAGRYDLLNHLLSFGVDRFWRYEAVRRALETRPERILDVATGTADLALELKKRSPGTEVIGVDFAEPMLVLGRAKAERQRLDVPLVQGDGQALAFGDEAFDTVTVAYGLRNFSDYEQGLSEFHRVLRPGGRLVVLEFPPPPEGIFGKLFRLYFFKITPLIAGVLSGRRDAYEYLGKSVTAFPPPEALADMMRQAGFGSVNYKLQTFGVSALHTGDKVAGDRV